MELAFLEIDLELGLRQQLQDLLDVGDVSDFVGRIDQNIVEVDDDDRIETLTEDVIQEGLKGSRGICEAKGHDKVFEVTITGTESGLPFLAFSDSDEIVSAFQVELSEDSGRTEAIQGLGDQGQRATVLDCDIVEGAIINAES
jgi:hypothetical protein